MTDVRVLFDEAHSEAWTIRPEVARLMQPAHPGDASYARAAAMLAGRGFGVHANVDGELTAMALSGSDLLVIAHPSEPKWERTTAVGSPHLSAEEIDTIEAFVRAGGGLIVLGETEQDKYGNNVNDLLARFGLGLANDTVQDYEHCTAAPTWILGKLGDGGRGRDGDLLARVGAACFYRATTITSSNGVRVLARTHGSASVPGAALIVAGEYGDGRVVVLADSDLFGDDCIGELDHADLWLNLAFWAARRPGGAAPGSGRGPGVAAPGSGLGPGPAPGRGPAPAATVELPAAWPALRDETDALALLQAPDGSLADTADCDRAGAHVDAIIAALAALRPSFPEGGDYLELVYRGSPRLA